MHKLIKLMLLTSVSLLLALGIGVAINDQSVNASDLTTQEEAAEGSDFRHIYSEGYLYNNTGNPYYLKNAIKSYIRLRSYNNIGSNYKPLAKYIVELIQNNQYSKREGYKFAPTVSQPMLEPSVMKMMNENYPYDEDNEPVTTSKAPVRHHVRRVRRQTRIHRRARVRRRTYRIRRVVRRHRSAWSKGVPSILRGNYTSYRYNHGRFGYGLRSHYRIRSSWMSVDPSINEPWMLHQIYNKKIGYHKYLIHGSNWKSSAGNFAHSSLTMQRLGRRMYVHYYGGSYIERHYTSGTYYRN